MEIFREYNEVDDIIESSLTASVISVTLSGTHLGVAWYNELTNVILVDIIMISADDLDDIIMSLKSESQPTLLLLQSKIVANKNLFELLVSKLAYPPINTSKGTKSIDGDNYPYLVPKSSSYHIENAMDLICNKLRIRKKSRTDNKSNTYYENYHLISSMIPLDNSLIQQALGSLLSYIQANILSLDDDINITSIGEYHKKKYMRVDENSIRSLQIFSQDVHPNLLKGHQHQKEGFSLFSILDRTVSLPGRNKFKEWMSKPFCDVQLINRRLDYIELIINPSNRDFQQEAMKNLKHMHDIVRILMRLKRVESTCTDWIKLHTSLEQAIVLLRLCLSFAQDDSRRQQDRHLVDSLISDIDYEEIESANRQMNLAIDFKASSEQGTITVKDGYDNILDDLRDRYFSLEEILQHAAEKILEIVPLVDSLNVEYFPQIGYLVAIKDVNESFLNELDSLDKSSHNLSFFYRQNDTVYFKHPIVIDLDNKYGDIVSDMKDRQRIVLLPVEEMLLDIEATLQLMASTFASLDAIISLGAIASEMRFVRPEIVPENVIVIKNGRHPLQELTVETFITNDTFINENQNVSLITGPNNSGKSVYIKQVAIIVYLAHIGSYVPCERAVVGLVDTILTRITSMETAISPLSSFSMDLTQVSKMLEVATERSLCLLDEFGKGTTPIDGISILAATIQRLIKIKAKTICALHFTEVFDANILEENYLEKVITFHMDVHTISDLDKESNSGDLREEMIAPLYKLRLGSAPSSKGISCAKAQGIPVQIINRALAVKEAILSRHPIKPLQIGDNLRTFHHEELLKFFFSKTDWTDDSIATNDDLKELKFKI